MLTEKLKEIDQQKSKLASLEQSLLEDLHALVGFESRSDLIKKLQGLGTGAKRSKSRRKASRKRSAKAAEAAPQAAKTAPKKARKKAAGKAVKKAGGRRKRTTITPELREEIVAAVKGGATSGAVATQFGVSVPTVQNIKKAAGLTRKS